MTPPRRELLQNTLSGEDRIALGPGISASLTVPNGNRPSTAQFELISTQSKDIDIVRHQGETSDGVSGVTITESNCAKFHEDFLIYMKAQGYAIKAAPDKVSPKALFSEEVAIGDRPLRQVVTDFQRALMQVKNITSHAIYRAVGPDAPNSSQGNAKI